MTGLDAPLSACSYVTFHHASGILETEQANERQWAKMVATILKQEEEELRDKTAITWSAYHASSCCEVIPCLSGLYPLFKESLTDAAMILHAMCLVKKSINYLNPFQVPVITGDQPI